ncbi:MAG TPA: hypothetical protein VMA73_13390 [Streptosporangiaceae bacterium]|nr:hypothetical protein [Streptosporangiaceae bacterium]
MVYESAEEFIARKTEEWRRDLALGRLIRMKDVGREAVHVYRREAWTFLVQDTYAEAVNVLERLTHLETVGNPAVAMTLPAVEYRLGYWIVGRIGVKAGVWTWGQSAPIMSDGDLEPSLLRPGLRGHCSQARSPALREDLVELT